MVIPYVVSRAAECIRKLDDLYEIFAGARLREPGEVRLGFVYRFSRSFGVLIEGRYQYLKGELSGDFEEFEKLDLSGFSAVLGLNIYFH